MRVIAYVQEPLSNAGSRCRIAALAPGLAAHGITLRVCPPVGERFAAWCRRGGKGRRVLHYLASLLRRLRDIPRAWRADAVIVFRGMFPVGRPWMEWLVTRFNRTLVFDFDDAIWLRPPFASGGYRWVDLAAPSEVLRRARVAVVGSPWLEEFAARHCRNVRVIPTCLDTRAFTEATPDPRCTIHDSRLTIGWIGTKSGFTYLHALDDVWRELQRRHGARLRVVSNASYAAEGLDVDNVPWSLAGEVATVRSFDIGIMPLHDTPFERGKAGFKLIQCMAAGVPCVASPVGVNRDICGADESRGLLARTPEEWLAKIDRLVTDPALRQQLGEAGQRHAVEHFDLTCAVDAWAKLLHDIAGLDAR